MNVIPGSHRGGPRNHMKDGAFSGVCQEPEAYADESRWQRSRSRRGVSRCTIA